MTTPLAPTPMSERLRTDYQWTPRQREVLTLIERGKNNLEIADALGISRDGVKYHVSEILSKLGAESREEAAEYWRRYNGMAPRFARVFRAVAGGTAMKIVAGTAAVGLAGAVAVVALLALNGDDDAPVADPDDEPTAVTTQTATPGIAGRDSTGDPELDAVIAAVVSGDRARMESFLRLEDVPCGEAGGPGNNLPCGSDPPGTIRRAFPHVGCDETYWTGGQFPWIDSFQSRSPQVYAAYRQDSSPGDPPAAAPAGSAVVLFQTSINGGFAVEAEDGQIVAERGVCGPFPYALTDGVPASDFILLPSGGLPVATATPAPQLTGEAGTDRIIRALVDGDWQTLADSFVDYGEPCAVDPQGVGSPPKCPTGVPDGGIVQTARVMACERAYLDEPAKFRALFEPMFRFPHRLHAVYRTDGASRFNWIPTGDVAIVTTDGGGQQAQVWYMEGDQLVGAWLGCGTTPEQMLEGVADADFIIRP